MRHSASWQNIWDDRILEIAYNDEDGAVTVKDLTDHDLIRTSRSTVSRRCSKLADHGLLKRVAEGVYLISEEGRGYLEEEYDVEQGMWLDRDQAASEGTTAGTNVEGTNGT